MGDRQGSSDNMVLQSYDGKPWGVRNSAGTPPFFGGVGITEISEEWPKIQDLLILCRSQPDVLQGGERRRLFYAERTKVNWIGTVKATPLWNQGFDHTRHTFPTLGSRYKFLPLQSMPCFWENCHILAKAQFRTGQKSRERSSLEKFSLTICQTQNIWTPTSVAGQMGSLFILG